MASPPVMKTPSGRQVELPKAFGLQNTGTVIGDYLIGTLEGQGAFGAFYRVTRNGGDQSELYGLKLSLQALCQYQGGDRDEFAARAGRELAALAGLRHPNIVKVRAFGTWPHDLGYPYLVTDFVEGSHLNSWRRKSHPSVMKMCALIAKVADACAYFHGLGLYHRDLKSENVLVRHSDGEPIIIDFGISRQALDDGVTRAGYTLGTRTHYAPEYVEFIGSDAFYKGMPFPWNVSADLYAIGIMAYEMFTGQMPWSGARDEQELYAQIRTVPPPLPSLRVPALPGAIDNIVMRLLAKRPEERFGSGAELADAFRRAMDDGRGVEEWEAPLDIPEGGSNEAPTGRPRRRAPVLDHDLAESALEMASVLAAAEARAGAGVASSFPAAMSGVTKEAVPSAASRPVGFAPPESDGAKSFVSPVPALLRANEKKAGVEDVPEPHIAPVSEVREGDWEAIRGRGPGELPAPLAPATPAPRARAKPSAAKPQEVDVEDGGIGFRAPTTVKPAFSSISPPPTARGPKEGDVDPNTPGGKGMFFNTQIRLQAASLRGTGAERKPKWLLLGGVSLVAVFLLFLFFAARGGDRSNEPRSNLLAEAEKQRKEAESGVVPPPTTVVARDVSPLSGSNQKTFGAEGATGKTPENVTGGLALGGPPPPVPSLGLPLPRRPAAAAPARAGPSTASCTRSSDGRTSVRARRRRSTTLRSSGRSRWSPAPPRSPRRGWACRSGRTSR